MARLTNDGRSEIGAGDTNAHGRFVVRRRWLFGDRSRFTAVKCFFVQCVGFMDQPKIVGRAIGRGRLERHPIGTMPMFRIQNAITTIATVQYLKLIPMPQRRWLIWVSRQSFTRIGWLPGLGATVVGPPLLKITKTPVNLVFTGFFDAILPIDI